MVSVTDTVALEGTPLGAAMVRLPVYVLAAKPAGFTFTCNTAGIEPLVGLILNHGADVEAEKPSPTIADERLTLCVMGVVAPAAATKASAVEETWYEIVAPGGSTFRTRSFPLSAMMRFPVGSRATPAGAASEASAAGPPSPEKP